MDTQNLSSSSSPVTSSSSSSVSASSSSSSASVVTSASSFKPVLAIDFGTCNTYLAVSTPGGRVEELVVNVGGDQTHGIASALLYRTAGERQGENTFGEEAIWSYAGSSPRKIAENGLRLSTGFKPDIEFSESARQDSEMFLKTILKTLNQENLHIQPLKMEVFFGVPSEASNGFRTQLLQIAKNAGFGTVRLLDEPFGALCSSWDETSSNLANRILVQSVLVVDFGGGTCDFALLQDGVIQHSWGDMFLGGRLIDDLFYQWFLEQTQNSEDPLAPPMTDAGCEAAHRDFYLRSIKCRELKELFSIAMGRNQQVPFETYFLEKYELVMRWNEFLERARHYTPSSSFRKQLEVSKDFRNVGNQVNIRSYGNIGSQGNIGNQGAEGVEKSLNFGKTCFKNEGPIDLIRWFENELVRGFCEKGIPPTTVDTVFLAGGSSCWLFVQDACREIFGPEKICRSNNVFAAISMGLAKYALIKKKSEQKIQELHDAVPGFVAEMIQKIHETVLDETDICRAAGRIFDQLVTVELIRFQKEGGKICELENRLKVTLAQHEKELEEILRPIFEKNGVNLNLILRDSLQQWFLEHQVDPGNFNFGQKPIEIAQFNEDLTESFGTGLGEELGIWLAGLICTAVIAIIVASATIGGPIAWGVAALITIGTGVAAPEYIKTKIYWPIMLSSFLMSSERIQTLRDEKFIRLFTERFQAFYLDFLKKNEEEIRKQIEMAVDAEIREFQKVLAMEK